MKMMKKFMMLLVAFALAFNVISLPSSIAYAQEEVSVDSYVSDLIAYYRDYQDAAQTDIDRILDEMASVNKEKAIVWTEIMEYWQEINTEGFANISNVPQGLSQENNLAVVILGFELNDDGTMKDELIGRLQTGLNIANAYPNAYVVVTGGGTAANNPNVTEGGLMGEWLLEQGLSEQRLIVENRAPDTVGNAQNTYAILADQYPQVDSVVLVTSDYHVPRGCLLYNSKFILEAYETNGEPLEIVANAGYSTGTQGYENIGLQSRGLASVAGVSATTSVELTKFSGLSVIQNTMYTVGSELDLEVKAIYNTGYSKDVSDVVTITNFDPTLQEQTITITYQEYGVDFECQFNLASQSKEFPELETINTLLNEAKAKQASSYTKTTFNTLQNVITNVEQQLLGDLRIEQVAQLCDDLSFAMMQLRARINVAPYAKALTSNAETVADNGINSIIDNNKSTYGTFGPDITQLEIVIELDGYYDVDEIVVRPYHKASSASDYTKRSYFYDLYVSEDGVNYTFVASHNEQGTKEAGNSHLVDCDLDVKYVKIDGTGKINPGNQTNMAFHLTEVYVYGEEVGDILIGKHFTSSGADTSASSSATATTQKALDGDRTTYWDAGAYNNLPWIDVDLGDVYKLDAINVINYYSSARFYHYEIYVSLDGIDYIKIAEKIDDTASTIHGTTFDLNEEWYASHIKVVGTYHSKNSAFHINELRAYGSLATADDQEAIDKQVQVQLRAGLLDALSKYYRSDYTQASWDEFEPTFKTVKEKAADENISIVDIEEAYQIIEEADDVLVKGNPDEKTEGAFRLASFNIWAPNPNHPDDEAILAQLLRCEVDYAGIQEVDRFNTRDNRDVINEIADDYYETTYQKAIDYRSGEYGIGQLSSSSILETTGGNYKLVGSEEGRAWQRMLVDIDGKQVAIYNSHFSLGQDAAFTSNVNEILAIMANDPVPYKLLTADFNASNENMDPFKETYNLANGNDGLWLSTFEGDKYADGSGYSDDAASADITSGIDNIVYTRNLAISNFRVVYGHGISDHCMVYADFNILAYEEDLQELVDTCNYEQALYTTDSWTVYSEALSEAQTLLTNTDYSQLQDELKASYEKLDAAVKALAYIDADYSKVDEAIAKVPTDLSIYTDESVATLQAALNDVVRNLKIDQQEVVNAYATTIQQAIAALVIKPSDYEYKQSDFNITMTNEYLPQDNGGVANVTILIQQGNYDGLFNGTSGDGARDFELKWDWEANWVDGKLPEHISLPITMNFELKEANYVDEVIVYNANKTNGYMTKVKAIAHYEDETSEEVTISTMKQNYEFHFSENKKVTSIDVTVLEAINANDDVVNNMVTISEIDFLKVVAKDELSYDYIDSAISDGQAIVTNNFTLESIKVLSDAIDAATAKKQAETKTQNSLDQKANAIFNAISQLEAKEIVDKTALEAKINEVVLMDTSKYSDASVMNLGTTLAQVKVVYNNADATQAEVNEALKTLEAAIKALELKPVEVDKEALKAAIEAAKAIDTTNKTDDSVEALVSALSEAEKVYANASATQASVDEAKAALDAAVANLKDKPQDPKPVMDFYDVQDKKAWFYGSVESAFTKGLMGATGKEPVDGKPFFEPDTPISRGMVATVLYRMAGKPAVEFKATFSDVTNAKLWYSTAITWASQTGVVSGYKDGRFGPDDNITRQDLAIMLRNYAKACGLDTNVSVDFSAFKDGNKVVSYAQSAIAFCIDAKLMSGSKKADGVYLNPSDNATRAECAKMFSLLDDAIKANK